MEAFVSHLTSIRSMTSRLAAGLLTFAVIACSEKAPPEPYVRGISREAFVDSARQAVSSRLKMPSTAQFKGLSIEKDSVDPSD